MSLRCSASYCWKNTDPCDEDLMSFWVIGPTGTRDASCRRHAILAVAAIPGAQMVDRREVGDQGDRP